MFFNWLWLEYEASAELYLPGLSSRRHSRNIAKGAGGCARNGRSSKDCVVERVEGLETKLEVDPVDDLDVLQDRSIHVVEAIGPHGAKGLRHGPIVVGILPVEEGRAIARLARRYRAGGAGTSDEDTGRVDDSRNCETGVARIALDVLGSHARLQRNVRREVDWGAGLELVDGVDYPTASDLIGELAAAQSEHLVAAEGQVIGSAHREVVRVIIGRHTARRLKVLLVEAGIFLDQLGEAIVRR